MLVPDIQKLFPNIQVDLIASESISKFDSWKLFFVMYSTMLNFAITLGMRFWGLGDYFYPKPPKPPVSYSAITPNGKEGSLIGVRNSLQIEMLDVAPLQTNSMVASVNSSAIDSKAHFSGLPLPLSPFKSKEMAEGKELLLVPEVVRLSAPNPAHIPHFNYSYCI